jgi:hypothetical protein
VVGCGTLLGFEESHSSCLFWSCWLGWVAFFAEAATLVVVGVLVGVVVDSWIVDASILASHVQCSQMLHQVFGGVWCRSL